MNTFTPEQQKEIEALKLEYRIAFMKRVQAWVSVIIEDGWKYSRQDKALQDYIRNKR